MVWVIPEYFDLWADFALPVDFECVFYSNSAVRMLFHPLAATARIKYVSFFWCQRNMGIESRMERSQVHVDEKGCLASAQARSCFSGKACFGPDKFCYLLSCSWGSTGPQACFSVHLNMCTCSALAGFTTWHLRAMFTEAKSPDLLWDSVAIFITAPWVGDPKTRSRAVKVQPAG